MRWFHAARKRRQFRRFMATAFTTLGVCLALSPLPAQAAVTCQDLNFPVTLGTMYGKLCKPSGATTVQVLIPGGTYNSSYWDIEFSPDTRSYRAAMNKAGFATLALDRLGTGRSAKPLSLLVTASAQAQAAHEVIQQVRPQFQKVIIGGHSIGAAMAMIEAGNYRDVDGVLVTGMTHRMNLITVLPVLANMIPAPLGLGGGLDPGYLTTSPGTRYTSFHAPGPNITGAITFDETTKDVFAATEAIDTIALTNVVIPATRRINAPVMLIVGNDNHFCGAPLGSDCSSAEALRVSEAPFFAPEAQLRTYILNGYGHSINYAPNAPDYHAVVSAWAKEIG
ncbi:pimeloyl-ACP methyl ester carboxylesterase [Kibdelosporangium banguiense]|uniref:Pimeloyl-ACP methyl ester carboxylesterase n=1 Tax=Kibdelosporangium banguiense TaxID=1365924 RepID=A0ABS4TFC9_9PSEU|nr:alpha/beta hydrolase [Kibdelosporangium banguiense]MBP2323074.1 pimeloyl-ACP methyl ester carboxylesterase [Kibdelosporangium banguiense]